MSTGDHVGPFTGNRERSILGDGHTVGGGRPRQAG